MIGVANKTSYTAPRKEVSKTSAKSLLRLYMNAPRHTEKYLSCHPVPRLGHASAGASPAAGAGSISAPFSGSSAGGGHAPRHPP